MNNRYIKIFISVTAVTLLITFFCSCSVFRKKAVAEAAVQFGEVLCTGDAADIIRKTVVLYHRRNNEFPYPLITICHCSYPGVFIQIILQSTNGDSCPTFTCEVTILTCNYYRVTQYQSH